MPIAHAKKTTVAAVATRDLGALRTYETVLQWNYKVTTDAFHVWALVGHATDQNVPRVHHFYVVRESFASLFPSGVHFAKIFLVDLDWSTYANATRVLRFQIQLHV